MTNFEEPEDVDRESHEPAPSARDRVESQVPPLLPLNTERTRIFLKLLDRTSTVFEFRTFDDYPTRKDRRLARKLTGTLEMVLPMLEALTSRGAGAFVVVNKTDGNGQSTKNVTSVRALFADTDGADVGPLLTLRPHIVVRSSPGKWHCYWLVEDCSLQDFGPIQLAIAGKYGTDKTVHDLPRVMRLPGFYHRKGDPFLVDFAFDLMKVDDPKRRPYTKLEIVDGLGLDMSPPKSGECFDRVATGNFDMAQVDKRQLPIATIMAMLQHLAARGCFIKRSGVEKDATGRIVKLGWIEAGMALKVAYGDDEGQALWAITHLDDQARADAAVQWRSFDTQAAPGRGSISIASIIKAARDTGFLEAVTLNDFHAYMPMHQYIFTPTGEPWPASSVDGLLPTVSETDASGSTKKLSPSRWLDRNRPVHAMIWDPDGPQIIRDQVSRDGVLIPHNGVTTFNLYRPPIPIPKGDAKRATPWIEHIVRVYPLEAQPIIAWLAHRLQRPGEKINHALVLGGAQGIGKDTILEPVKQSVGPWNFQEVSPQQLTQRFNGFLKAVVLRVSEARDLGDMNRFGFYEHMKTLAAAPPDMLRIDEKNTKEYYVRNCCGVIITTNYKTGLYLPADDRRHYVAWSDCTKGDFPDGYWADLWKWYDREGHAHVAAYLHLHDNSSFDPKAPPPKTQAFWEIVDANRAPEDAELASVIDGLCNPEALTLGQLKAATERDDDVGAWIRDRKNRRVISHRLNQCGYSAVRADTASDGLWRVCGQRVAIYARAELPERQRMRAAAALAAGHNER